MDANLGQPRASDRAHSPHQVDRQIVKEIQLRLGIDNHQPVRFGHLRGNFREVLGACHPDRDWKAKLCPHTTTYCSRDAIIAMMSDLLIGSASETSKISSSKE